MARIDVLSLNDPEVLAMERLDRARLDRTDEMIERIKVLDLSPGEIVVIHYPGTLSYGSLVRLREYVREVLDVSKNKVLILDQGMDLKIVSPECLKAELTDQK